jgi:hypothetical protein
MYTGMILLFSGELYQGSGELGSAILIGSVAEGEVRSVLRGAD